MVNDEGNWSIVGVADSFEVYAVEKTIRVVNP